MRALFLALTGAVLIGGSVKCDEAQGQKAHAWAVLEQGAAGCPPLEIFQKLKEAATSGDKDMYLTTTVYGGCQLFAAGSTLWIEEASSAGGALRVKAKGDRTSYWIPQETIFKPAS
jgi:hypothetical protein